MELIFKPQDLMIGDWVYNTHNRKPEQVCEVRERMVMLDYNDLYDYDEIEPIPLTSEILEQNGFVTKDKPDDWRGYRSYSYKNGSKGSRADGNIVRDETQVGVNRHQGVFRPMER